MKLLYCAECQDVFKLRVGEVRQCECGRVKGKYDDNGGTAVTNGKGFHIAIGNGSLLESLRHMASVSHGFYPVMCWTRRNSGKSNPRSRVDEELNET